MLDALRTRPVAKLPPLVRLAGRVLFLAEDAGVVQRQLAGKGLAWTPAIKLRDDIPTDEITPAYICYYFDETLGQFPYLGLKCGDAFPITRGAVKAGGFVASVSGKRRGKGSSREQSPYAEMCAGIKLVVAENIERIYRENCQNLGVLATTDFSIIDKVRRGEPIPLSAFTAGPRGMTPERVKEGLLDVALELEKKQRAFAEKQGIRLYGELRLGHRGSEAICHSKILEGHAEPGMVIIGSDSHTPHAGAVGCVAFGVGTTAIFNSWITKDVRLTVPETVKG